MKLNSINLAAAAAITTALSWIICTLLVWLMPGPTMSLAGHMFHLDISGLGWVLTFSGVVWGLLLWSLSVGLLVWLAASIYNLFTQE
ncbi:MAG TPA: hypothetical protein DEA22_04305 [Blastocatellia bacterium]|nr:hypothetical protein [Blastocatellia bacterium]